MTTVAIMNQNRESVFADTIVAGDTALLLDIPWNATYTNMVALFEGGKNDKGVFCGGAASMLYRKNVEAGLTKSFMYFYGIPGYMTHVHNVVCVNNVWYLQDSYFNQYHNDFLGMLAVLKSGGSSPATEGATGTRRMVWLEEGADDPVWPVVSASAVCKASVDFRASYYESAIVGQSWWPGLEPEFTSRGIPHAFSSFPCIPFAISGDQGYITDPNSTSYWGILGKIYDTLGIPR